MSAVAENVEVKTVTLTINGQEVQGREGQTILEVAQAAGVDIPTLCHDPRLEPYGACRMCLVEVEGARGPMASCGTSIRDGMKVETHSEKIMKMRKFILELLLTNHPLDCPVCEAAGNCKLQDYAYEYLVDMVPWGWRPPEAVDPGKHPNIAHFGSRCILCGRCVRICREVMGIGCWGYLNRGYDSEVDTPYRLPLKEVECVSCGQCVSTCPVGAIVGQRTAQGARAWQTTKAATTCSYCADGCQLTLHGYQGKVVKAESQNDRGLNQGNLCVKGRFGFGYASAPDRISTPLVRDSKGRLQESTWEDALKLVVEKVSVAAGDGGRGVGAICGTHATNEAAYLLQKLMREVIGSNNLDSIDSAETTGFEDGLGSVLGSSMPMVSRPGLGEADLILVIGANLTESHPVLALEVVKALRSGKKVIVIDPRRTELAGKATTHLPVKPGTDLAALRAMMRALMDEQLMDMEFINENSENFQSLETTLKGLRPDVEAATCGVDAELLRTAAISYGEASAATVIMGSGVAHGAKAATTASAVACLALMTGNIGRPGAGVMPLKSGANSQGVADMGVRPDRLPGGAGLGGQRRGATTAEMLSDNQGAGLGVVYVMGADPALAVADERAVRAALTAADFVVVQDAFPSATSEHADVILPAAVSAEDDGTFTNGERYVQRVRSAVEPAGDSKPDWRIVQSLANALGEKWAYGSAEAVMEEIQGSVELYGGVTYAGIDSKGLQLAQGEMTKGTFVPLDTTVAGAVTDAKFPLALTTGTVREHHGTGVRSRRAPGLTELVDEATLEISAKDAETAKVSDGAKVRVISQHGGEVEVKAKISPSAAAGVVFMSGFDESAPVSRLLGREGSAMPAVRIETL